MAGAGTEACFGQMAEAAFDAPGEQRRHDDADRSDRRSGQGASPGQRPPPHALRRLIMRHAMPETTEEAAAMDVVTALGAAMLALVALTASSSSTRRPGRPRRPGEVLREPDDGRPQPFPSLYDARASVSRRARTGKRCVVSTIPSAISREGAERAHSRGRLSSSTTAARTGRRPSGWSTPSGTARTRSAS